MARTITCKFCGEKQFDIDSFLKPNTKGIWYCNENCYNQDINKNKAIEKSDYTQLTDYLNELYEGKCNFPLVTSQIKKMCNEHKFTYMGILLTLRFIYEFEDITLMQDKGIGLVPYYYQQTKEHWIKQQEVEKAINEFDLIDEIQIIKKSPRLNKIENIVL